MVWDYLLLENSIKMENSIYYRLDIKIHHLVQTQCDIPQVQIFYQEA